MKAITEKQEMGYVCPEWARSYWKRDASMILPSNDGKFVVVCNETQVTVFVAETEQECRNFLGNPTESFDYWCDL